MKTQLKAFYKGVKNVQPSTEAEVQAWVVGRGTVEFIAEGAVIVTLGLLGGAFFALLWIISHTNN